MKEIAVVNSTCLISLERIGQLGLLQALFEPIVVPPKVYEEFGGSVEWLHVQAPQNAALVTTLSQLVDDGEAQALALACELSALLILDDRKARRWAKRLGIRVLGTIGVLLRAKNHHLIPAVRPHMEALKSAGFYLSPELEQEVLRLTNE